MSGPKAVFQPQPRMLALIDREQWADINNFQGLTTATSGSVNRRAASTFMLPW